MTYTQKTLCIGHRDSSNVFSRVEAFHGSMVKEKNTWVTISPKQIDMREVKFGKRKKPKKSEPPLTQLNTRNVPLLFGYSRGLTHVCV